MSARITRSAKSAPKPPRPKFPVRKPALVTAADSVVQPINKTKVQAVYTRQGWLMWGIIIVCMAIAVFFWEQIKAAASWAILQANEREYARLGEDVCTQPLLTVANYTCEPGAEGCFTSAQAVILSRYEEQARGYNQWRAERCLPLMR